MFLLKYNNLSLLHFLLFPVFFIWHMCNEYFGLIPASYWSEYLLYYIGLSVLSFLLGIMLFKKKSKPSIWAFALLSVFFFLGLLPWFSQHTFITFSKFLQGFTFAYIHSPAPFRYPAKKKTSSKHTKNKFLSEHFANSFANNRGCDFCI